MVIDTSAILAILLGEDGHELYADAIYRDPVRLTSAVCVLEAGLVIEARKGQVGGRELDLFLHRAKVSVVPFTEEQAELARGAWRQFGKGRHSARLNLCDCTSYALSSSTGEALLFKGKDFSKTDVRDALSESGAAPT
ncbi:MAG: type II toxin-antitoxin system VapC family toxin [bacterium]|nr:type II toxin-antitoxin system VapC family toxin [bacterium]